MFIFHATKYYFVVVPKLPVAVLNHCCYLLPLAKRQINNNNYNKGRTSREEETKRRKYISLEINEVISGVDGRWKIYLLVGYNIRNQINFIIHMALSCGGHQFLLNENKRTTRKGIEINTHLIRYLMF